MSWDVCSGVQSGSGKQSEPPLGTAANALGALAEIAIGEEALAVVIFGPVLVPDGTKVADLLSLALRHQLVGFDQLAFGTAAAGFRSMFAGCGFLPWSAGVRFRTLPPEPNWQMFAHGLDERFFAVGRFNSRTLAIVGHGMMVDFTEMIPHG